MLTPWRRNNDKPRQYFKKHRHYFADKGSFSQSYGFFSNHVRMWELDHKESWALKNWCLWTVVWRTLESPLDCKEIQPVHPKGNQSRIFIGSIDAEAEAPILWPPDTKNWLIRKGPWCWWESKFLGRLIRNPGFLRRRKGSRALEKQKVVWGSQGDKNIFYIAFFKKLFSTLLCFSQYNKVSYWRTCFSLTRRLSY